MILPLITRTIEYVLFVRVEGVALLNSLFPKEGWGDLHLEACLSATRSSGFYLGPPPRRIDIFACITVHLAQFSQKT
jgi:hypothetical protein